MYFPLCVHILSLPNTQLMLHHSIILLVSLSHMSHCFGWFFWTYLLTIHSPEAQKRFSCIACRSLLRGRNCVVCAKSQSVPLLSETTVRGREETRCVREALLCQHPAFPRIDSWKKRRVRDTCIDLSPSPTHFFLLLSFHPAIPPSQKQKAGPKCCYYMLFMLLCVYFLLLFFVAILEAKKADSMNLGFCLERIYPLHWFSQCLGVWRTQFMTVKVLK